MTVADDNISVFVETEGTQNRGTSQVEALWYRLFCSRFAIKQKKKRWFYRAFGYIGILIFFKWTFSIA